MEAKEAVIDKLLLWVTLNSEEETLRQEIIQERADRKAQFEIRLKEAE
jgi:hypothetical protein